MLIPLAASGSSTRSSAPGTFGVVMQQRRSRRYAALERARRARDHQESGLIVARSSMFDGENLEIVARGRAASGDRGPARITRAVQRPARRPQCRMLRAPRSHGCARSQRVHCASATGWLSTVASVVERRAVRCEHAVMDLHHRLCRDVQRCARGERVVAADHRARERILDRQHPRIDIASLNRLRDIDELAARNGNRARIELRMASSLNAPSSP